MNVLDPLRAYCESVDPEHAVEVRSFDGQDEHWHSTGCASWHEGSCTMTPLLVCTADTFRPVPPPFGLSFVVLSDASPLSDIIEGLDTNERGFDPRAAPVSEESAIAFRSTLTTSRAWTARLDGAPVAAGAFNPPIGGVSELVGITTLEPYRRRGIAAAIASDIARVAFEHGVTVAFLRTDNPTACRIYQRLGFTPVAVLVSRRKP